tara:strand:+ start:396 stop:575 length:180 start_codon:yes stop_codon:yes gene_type:complete
MTEYELIEQHFADCSPVGGGLIRSDIVHVTFDRFEALSLRDTLKRKDKLVNFHVIRDED